VHCDFAGKPAWAHSDAVIAAFKEGADFAYRCNDDSAFPTTPDWVDRFVSDLRARNKPNLGVVGPKCGEGAHYILTHDFVHRTHAAIFGFQYPRSLPDWSSDDWITYVYKQFDLLSKREDVPIRHMMHGQRYSASEREQRLTTLQAEVDLGAGIINAWAKERYGAELPFTRHVVDRTLGG
jgi:hypothetical protein